MCLNGMVMSIKLKMSFACQIRLILTLEDMKNWTHVYQ